jgi:GntR family transcriptional regulator/MocR family aminotransferase
MHLSSELTVPLSDADIARTAFDLGLMLQPLSSYRVGDGRPYNGFVLGYSGLSESTIEQSTMQLADVIAALYRARSVGTATART